jgi:hypothetical protein
MLPTRLRFFKAILREIAPKGAQAAKAARALRKAEKHREQTGQVLTLEPQDLKEWPPQQYPQDFMAF